MSVRRWFCWRWAAHYFPITVVKTADLLPNGHNYLAVCHPHGAMAFSHGLTILSEAMNISSQLFPGLRCYLFTIWFHYWIPFIRELFYGLGGRAATDETMTDLFANSTNTLAALIVGGARDIIVERSDEVRTVVRRRHGFCRIALKSGTHLVPVFSFGEDQIYTTDSLLRPFVVKLMEYGWLICAIAVIRGRWHTVIPHRVPVTIVFGAPLGVSKIDNPTQRDIEQLNDRYCAALTTLYEDHKSNYGYGDKALVLL